MRAAAIRALDTVMPTQRRSLAARLAKETNPDVLDAVAHLSGADGDAGDSDRALADAASGRLSGADVLKRHLARAGSRQPLPVLDDLLKVVVARAARIRDPEEAAEWLDVRAGLHAALASRGSRLGLYDLRDALDAWQEPQPRAFITAARAVGDASCLEPLGRAFARVLSEWSRHDILLACRDILRRERLTRRHQVVRRLVRQVPALAAVLWPTKAQGSGLRAQGGSRP